MSSDTCRHLCYCKKQVVYCKKQVGYTGIDSLFIYDNMVVSYRPDVLGKTLCWRLGRVLSLDEQDVSHEILKIFYSLSWQNQISKLYEIWTKQVRYISLVFRN